MSRTAMQVPHDRHVKSSRSGSLVLFRVFPLCMRGYIGMMFSPLSWYCCYSLCSLYVCEGFILRVWDDVRYFQCCRSTKITYSCPIHAILLSFDFWWRTRYAFKCMHLCISSLSWIKLCGLEAVIVNNLITTYPDLRSIMEVSLLLGSVGLLGATLSEWISSQVSALLLCCLL